MKHLNNCILKHENILRTVYILWFPSIHFFSVPLTECNILNVKTMLPYGVTYSGRKNSAVQSLCAQWESAILDQTWRTVRVRQDGTCLQMSDANCGARAVWRCNVFWLWVWNQRGRRTDEDGDIKKSHKRRAVMKEMGSKWKWGAGKGGMDGSELFINTQWVDNVSVPSGNKWGWFVTLCAWVNMEQVCFQQPFW